MRRLLAKWQRLALVTGTVTAGTGFAWATTKIVLSRSKRLDDSSLPLRFHPEQLRSVFDGQWHEVLVRTTTILGQIGPLFAKALLWEHLIRGKLLTHQGIQKKYAMELRKRLTILGPCFIKLGQALSIRPDLLPSVVMYELQKLCDEVPPFSTEVALQVMTEELKRDPRHVFLDLSPETPPIAAASLGQVYKVRLKDDPCTVLALKVQRPDMLRGILLDLYILRNIAKLVEFVKRIITNQRPYNVAIIDNFGRASLLELDYLHEAQNQERFRRELIPIMNGEIYIPQVFHDLTSRRLLVTEWVEGKKLAQSPPDVINKLTPVGVRCFLAQLLEMGYFHSDPHPGNLLVTSEGLLALIDFGLCAEVPLPDTRHMTLAIVHLMQGDALGLVEDAIELGFLPREVDLKALTADVQQIFDNAELAVQNSDDFSAVTRRRKRFVAVSFELNRIFFMYPFLVPDYFALISRAMVVLEGIALTGNSQFDLFHSAYPYALSRAVRLFGVSNVSQIAKEAIIHFRNKSN